MKKHRKSISLLLGIAAIAMIAPLATSCGENPQTQNENKIFANIGVEIVGKGALKFQQNGSETTDKQIEVDKEVILIATPEEGYELEAILINQEDFTITKKVIFQKDLKYSIKVIFKEIKQNSNKPTPEPIVDEFSIKIGEHLHGEVKVSKLSGKVGDLVTINAIPNDGFKLQTLLFNNKEVKNNSNVSPIKGVNTVKAIFVAADKPQPEPEPQPEEKKFNIEISSSQFGEVIASKTNGIVGESITFKITPNKGYRLKTFKINGAIVNSEVAYTPVEGTNSVEAIFEKIEVAPNPEENKKATIIVSDASIKDAAEYIPDVDSFECLNLAIANVEGNKLYGTQDHKIRFGNSSTNGNLGFTFEKEYNIKKIIIKGSSYKEDGVVPLKIDDGKNQNDVSLKGEVAEYTYDKSVQTSYLKISTAEVGKRLILNSIELVLDEKNTDSPDIPSPDVPHETKDVSIDIVDCYDKGQGASFTPTLDNFNFNEVGITSVSGENLFKDPADGIRFSSSKKSGILNLQLDRRYNIHKVVLIGSNFADDIPEVTVDNSYQSVKTNFNKKAEFVFNGNETNELHISSPKKQRFVLKQIILTIGGNNQEIVPPNPDGGEKPDVPETPDVPLDKSLVKIEQFGEGNGTIEVSAKEGKKGDKISASIRPDSNSKIATIFFNYQYVTIEPTNQYTFTLEEGVNTLTVTFVPSDYEGNKFDYLYNNQQIKPNRGTAGKYDSYYEPVRGLKGEALKQGLHNIIKGHKAFSYKSLNESMKITDVDPFNSSNIIFTYEGSLKKGTSFNKEHTWAKSHGNFGTSTGPGSDMHHLRPSDSSLNSTRSNFDFAKVTNGQDCGEGYKRSRPTMKGNKVGGGFFEPKDEFKGDVARMIFYMATRYEGDDFSSDLEVSAGKGLKPIDTNKFNVFSGATGVHGDFNSLYERATTKIDPVSDFEMSRNNIIDEKYQHNRNPFIDHPEFIIMIYDKTYSGPGALNE